MAYNGLSDSNVDHYEQLSTPEQLKQKFPLTERAWNTVYHSRESIKSIINGKDCRKIIVVGPCSIHNIDEAKEYAQKLSETAAKVKDKLVVVMRTYFEKPRTVLGWKGLVPDPRLNGSADMELGRSSARELLLYINELGLPAATEPVSTRNIQCYDHLISYACIGARTTEAQTHRELASGLTMPVGFKNSTTGDVTIAIDALLSAREPHQFDGMQSNGSEAIVYTKGNKYGFIVLRGSNGGPNYQPDQVREIETKIKSRGLKPRMIIDCNHGNSGKNFQFQPVVFRDVIKQIRTGSPSLMGLMIESNLKEGKQNLPQDLIGFDHSKLEYGLSVTDSCLGWEETQNLILEAYCNL